MSPVINISYVVIRSKVFISKVIRSIVVVSIYSKIKKKKLFICFLSSGLNYKHITIINYDYSLVNKFGTSLTDDAIVNIYNCHMFIVQATGDCTVIYFTTVINSAQ